jgi:esterase/lipase superfamily enzyme
MGSWLTMEALRQLALTQQSGVLASIASVTLIAPDVDVDVFQKQIAQLPALKSKVLVVASSYDFALGFSKRLSAGVLRLGQRAAAYLQDIGIRFVDATSRRTDPIWGHYRATDPTVISHIKDMLGLVPQRAIAQARE